MHNVNDEWPTKVFFASEPKANGFDCQKDAFIGESGVVSNPIAVEEGRCRNSESEGRSSIFVFQHSLNLKGGEEKEILVSMGVLNSILIERDIRLEVAKEEFLRLKAYWDKIINEGVVVETQDKNLNLFVNIWNKYQNRINFWWYRSAASYYMFGFDTFGYRDVAQTIIGTLPMDAELARGRIKFISKFQFKDGNTCSSFSQISMRCTRADNADVPLWYFLAVFCYLKETGDFDFLYEEVYFLDGGKGTIYDHAKLAIDYVLSRRSDRGLVLIERGDWNDGLDFVGNEGNGESVMASQMLYLALDRWIKLNEFLEFRDVASQYRKELEGLRGAIYDLCWDGEWYVRAFKDNGEAIGSKINEEGPAYSRPDRSIGLITRFVRGEKENGAVFMHASAWSIIAAALLGRGNKAYEYYKKMLPMNLASNPAFKTEPYVYPEYVAGPDSPHYGESSHSWLTGCAVWMWRACVDYILGVRPELDGLKIDPCIPAEWSSYNVKRRFRSAFYDITVTNPEGVQYGVREIRIDGEKYESNILPVYADGRIHHVEVILG
jgi:cellobiose phosphorylase